MAERDKEQQPREASEREKAMTGLAREHGGKPEHRHARDEQPDEKAREELESEG